MSLFHQKALPDLGNNLKCGNALIDTTFYDNEQMFLLDEEDRLRVNAFDWMKKFPQQMKQKFDVIIGNPPYGYSIDPPESQFYRTKFTHQDYQQDLYLLFLERYSFLLKSGGRLGIITSNTWLQSVTLRSIRRHLTRAYLWHRVLALSEKVFDAIVDTHVVILELKSESDSLQTGSVKVDGRRSGEIYQRHEIPWSSLPTSGDPVNVIRPISHQILVQKIKANTLPLLKIINCFNGIKPFEVGKGIPAQTRAIVDAKPFVAEGGQPGKDWEPLLRGSLIRRFQVVWSGDYWIKYGAWLAAPRDPAIFRAHKKIMVRQTGDSIVAAVVPSGFYARNNMHILVPKMIETNLYYIVAILNSKLMDFIYSYVNPEKGEALAEVKKHHLEQLPLPTIADDDVATKAVATKAKMLTERIAKRSEMPTGHKRNSLTQEIETLAAQIDRDVYSLYGLTDPEVALVEQFASQHASNTASLRD